MFLKDRIGDPEITGVGYVCVCVCICVRVCVLYVHEVMYYPCVCGVLQVLKS